MLIFGGSCICILIAVSAFLAVLPMLMVIIGSIYLHDCPANKLIPIYLIVGGCAGVVSSCCRDKEQKERKNALGYLLDTFFFVWFIVGCVAIYQVYPPDYVNLGAPNYCNKTVYLFSFWLVNICLAAIGLVIVFGLCTCFVAICVMVLGGGDDDCQQQQQQQQQQTDFIRISQNS